ncbi:MAG: hypothetical protein CMO29_03845 [Tistrella sp.]|nr:hypothetical protein [uncultured Tistrella sp.]MAM72934.1 hypothetical protein [Tistrella sp.]
MAEPDDTLAAAARRIDLARLRELAQGPAGEGLVRIARILLDLYNTRQDRRLTLAEFERDPGRVLADLDKTGPLGLTETRGDGPEAVLIGRDRLALLIDALVTTLQPKLATAGDLYEHLAHDGPPHALAADPPSLSYEMPSLADVLGRPVILPKPERGL